MKFEIKYYKKEDELIAYILSFLPDSLRDYLSSFINKYQALKIDEIRLHAESYLSLICNFKNIKTDYYVSKEIIDKTVYSLCQGSVYAHFNTIKDGYISIGQGIRVGVCGKATIQEGSITAISDYSSLNIRIPKRIFNSSEKIFEILSQNDFSTSILLYSPPGVGKTTILRDLICKLSDMQNPLRVCVVDSREELCGGLDNDISSDFFISYPKGTAINLATRVMTPQIIICDEISTKEEAEAILASVNCGVSFIATTHASSYDEVIRKKILSSLFDKKVFEYVIGVTRDYGSKKYEFFINKTEEVIV